MQTVKVKYKSSFLDKRLMLCIGDDEFERIGNGIFGFKLRYNDDDFIITEKTIINNKKALNVLLYDTKEVICTIFPRLYRKEKEYFEYKTKDYKLPTFWDNEISELNLKFSKTSLAGLWRWNKKSYFASYDSIDEKLLALSLVAYIEDGSEAD